MQFQKLISSTFEILLPNGFAELVVNYFDDLELAFGCQLVAQFLQIGVELARTLLDLLVDLPEHVADLDEILLLPLDVLLLLLLFALLPLPSHLLLPPRYFLLFLHLLDDLVASLELSIELRFSLVLLSSQLDK